MTEERELVVNPALLRGLTQRRVSRRDVLKGMGVGAGALSLSAVLAACGVSGSAKVNPTSSASVSPDVLKEIYGDGKPAGKLNFANWEDYIDVNSKGKSPTLTQFTKDTGIQVDYKTVINDNAPFVAKIVPVIQSGGDTGYDIVVLTNGGEGIEAMIKLGFLTPLDHQYLPNFAQYASDAVKNPVYDPGNKYSVAWQSGFTVIGYNSDSVKDPPKGFADLLNPKYKGKVGMFGNNQDLPCAALVHLGFDIQTSTPDQWRQAADVLTKQRDDGIVRSYYDQGYIDALENGETIITQAWSGDLFIASAPKDYGGDGFSAIKSAIPGEGGILWTDNMCIPLHAQHPVDAITMMNYVYQPKIAAQLADFIWYVSPVPSAKDIVLNDIKDPLVANSPLVFPSPDDLAKAHKYKEFKDLAEKEEWDSIFQPIYSS